MEALFRGFQKKGEGSAINLLSKNISIFLLIKREKQFIVSITVLRKIWIYMLIRTPKSQDRSGIMIMPWQPLGSTWWRDCMVCTFWEINNLKVVYQKVNMKSWCYCIWIIMQGLWIRRNHFSWMLGIDLDF